MATMLTLLAGEGRTEIGGYAGDPAYPDERPGVLFALLETLAPGRYVVTKGVLWKSIRKYKAGQHRGAETRNVLGLALMGFDSDCQAVVFTRDRDRSAAREKEIEMAIKTATGMFSIAIVGGMAVEAIESWMLALLGDEKAEKHADPKAELAKRGVNTVEDKVRVVRQEAAKLDEAKRRSASFATWAARL
jgi:hypothetical protein